MPTTSSGADFSTAQGAVETIHNANSTRITTDWLPKLNGTLQALNDFTISLPQTPTPISELETALAQLNNLSDIDDLAQLPQTPQLPTAPDQNTPDFPELRSVDPNTDTFNDTAPPDPGYQPPHPPGALTVQVPTDVPDMLSENAVQAVVSNAPSLDTNQIPLPQLTEFSAPSAPSLTLPAFSASFQGVVPALPNSTVVFSEATYSSTLLTEVKSQLNKYFAGGTALPPEIEAALWDRGREREDVAAFKAVQEATEEWSSRGFEVPAGELQRMVQEARQKNQDAVNSLEREIAIKQHQTEVENLRAAVQQGIALEGVLTQLHNSTQQRAFELGAQTAQLAVQVYNTQVQIFNSRVQQYTAEAQVYRDRIEAEGLKIQNYKTIIDAEGVKMQANVAKVQVYTARIQALQVAASIYEARVKAVTSLVQIDAERINAFKTRVEAFTSQVQAKTAEFQGYQAQVQGEAQKVAAFQAQVQAFAEKIKAFTAKVDAKRITNQAIIEDNKGKLDAFVAKLGVFRESFNAYAQTAAAQASMYGAQATYIGAFSQNAKAKADVETARAQLGSAIAHDIDSITIQDTQIKLDSVVKTATLLQANLEAVAKVYAQLVSGAMAAVSGGASISASASSSYSAAKSKGASLSVQSDEASDFTDFSL